MIDDPQKLAAFAARIGLTVHEGEPPTTVLTRLMRLATQAIDVARTAD